MWNGDATAAGCELILKNRNQELWIVSRTGLIKMKPPAGRPKDLIDTDRTENEES